MDDVGTMRVIERVGDLDGDAVCVDEFQRAALEPSRQCLSLEILHHEIVDIAVPSDVVKRADVRVCQRRNRLRFAVEPVAERGVGGERSRQDLDRDRPIQARVTRPVHFAHATGANRRLKLIRSKADAGSQSHEIRDYRPSDAQRFSDWLATGSGRQLVEGYRVDGRRVFFAWPSGQPGDALPR